MVLQMICDHSGCIWCNTESSELLNEAIGIVASGRYAVVLPKIHFISVYGLA